MTNARVAANPPKSMPVHVPSSVQSVLSEPGQPLDTATQAYIEPRSGHNFSQMSIHPGLQPPLVVQAKLQLNQADDPYEREAEQVSNDVMQSRKSPESPRSQSPLTIQGRVPGNDVGLQEAPPLVDDVLRSPGQPLDRPVREFFENRFGHQFSGVRVHSDARAAESAQAVNALAYTVGKDVVFGAGKYAPGTHSGKQLLAHELTHVVQQSGATGTPPAQPRLVQRSLDTYLKAMNQKPRDWYTAAKHLNGESKSTILQMLKNLGDPKLIAELHKAAVDGPGVGPCSNVAMLTEADYLKVNPGEKPFDRATCSKPAETKKADDPTIEVITYPQDRQFVETLPEYIDNQVYAVGIRLMDQTYHLFIDGRENPLTIPVVWFGQQKEAVNNNMSYPSRERALEVIGSNANGYAYWRTDEDRILPSHFTQTSAPRINTLALASLEEAGRYGKEIFSNILIGMIYGKAIEFGLRGAGYVVSKHLRRLENAPIKPGAGTGIKPPTETPPASPKATEGEAGGSRKVIPIEEGKRIRERKGAVAAETPEEMDKALASGDRTRASSGTGKKGGGKVVPGQDVESETSGSTKGGANVPPEKPPVPVDPRVRGVAIESRHLDSMPEYTRAKEHNFPGIEGWKGGTERMRDMASGKTRVISGADVIQIKSVGSSNPRTIDARAQEGIRGLETDIFAAGNTRVINPKGRRLDMVFDEGALTDLTPELRQQLTNLTKSAGEKGVEMRWFRFSADREIRIGIP